MNFKYSGLLFVLTVTLEAINGLALENASGVKSHTLDLPRVNLTIEKSQNSTENDGPVIVSKSPVTVIVANASEILPKSDEHLTKPHTTTTSTTTTTTTTSTTTSTTTTTTTVAPPSSTTPSPVPAPQIVRWVIRDEKTNTICVIAQMAMQLNVTYPGVKNQVLNTTLSVPGKNQTINGSCSENPQTVKIEWDPGHSIEVNFGKNDTAKNFYISGLTLNVNASVFKDVADNTGILTYVNNSKEFTTPLKMSYKCGKVQKVDLESEKLKMKAVLSLNDTQFEAFMNKTKAEFGAAQDCDTFDTPDIVPIAVGSALAILVLVVLAAYLIGRRRSQNRGYLSM